MELNFGGCLTIESTYKATFASFFFMKIESFDRWFSQFSDFLFTFACAYVQIFSANKYVFQNMYVGIQSKNTFYSESAGEM